MNAGYNCEANDFSLTKDDKRELRKQFPELKCSVPRKLVWGQLHFPSKNIKFDIEINFQKPTPYRLPGVFETSNILQDFVLKSNIENQQIKRDAQTGETICLLALPYEFPYEFKDNGYKWRGVCAFLEELVIPFFRRQAAQISNGKI